MNRFFCYFLGTFFLLVGCAKNKHLKIPHDQQTGPTIQVISGQDQTGNAGTVLKDSIIIQINEPIDASAKLLVAIHQKTNQGDTVIQKHILNDSKFGYSWLLNNNIGVQTLKFTVLDSTSAIIDSVNVNATAVQGWIASLGVNIGNSQVPTFAKLSTGRLLLGAMGAYKPYYSDDNGVTWHTIDSFYFNYNPWAVKIVVSPSDEIFIGTEQNGVYYSADGGMTWEDRSNGIPDLTRTSDLVYTRDGKLLFTAYGGGIYTSADKGLHWTAIINNDPTYEANDNYAGMQANNDIFFLQTIVFNTTVARLDHTDLKLHAVTGLPIQNVSAYYTDETGNSYVGGSNGSNIELYRSSDNITWNKVFSLPLDNEQPSNTLFNISKQDDGYYYFYAGGGFYKTIDFTKFQAIPATIPANSLKYIVASNGNLVINSYPISVWYYQQ